MAAALFADPFPRAAANDSSSPRRPGDALIEALQNRSAVDRWILLRQEQRQRQKPSETPFESEKQYDTSIPHLNTPGPKMSKPFPEPGMKPQTTETTRSRSAFSEPVRLDQPIVQRVPAPRESRGTDDPEQLQKITDILPYHDYSPKTSSSNSTKKTEPPKEMWTSKAYTPRKFDDVLFTWEASDLYHNPLYFEDPALERYGHTYPDVVQPFASVGRFGLQLFGLPYQMTIDPICAKHYTLGWYRPGECAPKLLYQIPWNARAAKVQAGVVTGMFFLIP